MDKKNKQKKRIKHALAIFIAVLICTLGLEFFMHPHGVFGIEGTTFFHAWYGFFACLAIIIVSKILGFFLKRSEDYYSEDR